MNSENLVIFETPEELAIGFAESLAEKISSLLTINENINIALSGGNTPIEIFKVLAADYKDEVKWNSINFYWVDERSVPGNSPESNYGNADKFLFSKIEINRSNIHPIDGETNPLREAERYSELVLQNVPLENSLPSFDIILLGIGEDGHTASIFPNQMELLRVEKVYDVSFHPQTTQRRVTMTGRTINNAKNIYFLASGEGKSKIIDDIFNGSEEAEKYPASHVNPVKGKIFWVIDKAAGSCI